MGWTLGKAGGIVVQVLTHGLTKLNVGVDGGRLSGWIGNLPLDLAQWLHRDANLGIMGHLLLSKSEASLEACPNDLLQARDFEDG